MITWISAAALVVSAPQSLNQTKPSSWPTDCASCARFPRCAARSSNGESAASGLRWCRPWARCMPAISRWCGRHGGARGASSSRSSSTPRNLRRTRISPAIREASIPTSPRSAEMSVDLVWAPPVAVMYPPGFATRIVPEGPATVGLEDKFRPHFFGGVATVVGKLLIQCAPDFAMFGEKDYQQLKVVTRMAKDLDLPREDRRRPDRARAGRPRSVVTQRLFVGKRAGGGAHAASRA